MSGPADGCWLALGSVSRGGQFLDSGGSGLGGVSQHSTSFMTGRRKRRLPKAKTAPKGNAAKCGERTPSRATGGGRATGPLE